jgi:hypothetical protein
VNEKTYFGETHQNPFCRNLLLHKFSCFSSTKFGSTTSATQNSVQLQVSVKKKKKKTCTERERGRARRERSRNGFEKTEWVGLRETMGERNRKKKLKEKN